MTWYSVWWGGISLIAMVVFLVLSEHMMAWLAALAAFAFLAWGLWEVVRDIRYY